jgi:soluble lytic murein transglycosylase-like protein
MKAICIATVVAVVSTPALAREAHHHKHVRYHHRPAVMTDAWQPFGGATMVPERWDAQARTPRIALDASPGQGAYAEMVARHAAANGVPVSLVHRVIMRESRYNPRAVSKGNYGMMQIRLGTARAMGYTGTASGLLDPEVNMTYAVKYLAGAYKTAGGSEGGAVANYARGYYHQAKRRGLSPYEAPGAAAFAMQPSARGFRIGQINSDANGRMMADRHMVF